ncbi:MAG: aminotransferase class IV [Alphaproteobacteria bacterium]
MIVWLNGALCPIDEARIDPRDRGFLLGDGVFETLPANGGRLFRLADHLARMRNGADLLGLPALPADGEIEQAALATLAANGLAHDTAALRITYSRGPGPRGLAPPDALSPTLLVSVTSSPVRAAPVRAVITRQTRNEASPVSRIKSLNYLDNILARREAEAAGYDDGLLRNGAGALVCASAANLFLVEDGALVTPAVTEGALPGVTRAVVIELARAMDIAVDETAVAPERLSGAGEAFLTNSLIGVIPLIAVDGLAIGDGAPGPVTRRIEESYAAALYR